MNPETLKAMKEKAKVARIQNRRTVAVVPAHLYTLIAERDELIAEIERQAREIERLRHERNELGNAIAGAAMKRGIIDGSMPLDGPQLLMICNDLAD